MTVKQAGALGGRARAAKETPEQRQHRMQRVACARWNNATARERLRAMQPALAARWNGKLKKRLK